MSKGIPPKISVRTLLIEDSNDIFVNYADLMQWLRVYRNFLDDEEEPSSAIQHTMDCFKTIGEEFRKLIIDDEESAGSNE